MSDDYDSPWKEALEFYLRDFLELLFPQAASEIDWSRGYEFLEQELQQIMRDAETSRRTVDKLVRVYRLGGEEAWVLIHIEVQGQWEAGFDERMFICHYRIFDLSKRPVASFVVYSDENPNWRPSQYGYELWGNRMQYDFPSAKLTEFLARWDELERSKNPIAVVIMAHLKTQQTRGDNDSRYVWKRRLAKMLHDRGFERDDIRRLYRTIDWLMRLPKAMDASCWAEIRAYEEEQKMAYITTAERVGREMGLVEGLASALNLLQEQQHGPFPEEIKLNLTKLSPEQLMGLIRASLEKKDPSSVPATERAGREIGLTEGRAEGLLSVLNLLQEQGRWRLPEGVESNLDKFTPEQLTALIKESLEAEKKKTFSATTAGRQVRKLGVVDGLVTALNLNLEQRLWILPEEIKARFETLSPEQLTALIKESLIAPTMDDFIKQIPAAE